MRDRRKHSLGMSLCLSLLALVALSSRVSAQRDCPRHSVDDRAFLVLPLNQPDLGRFFCSFLAPPCHPDLSLCLGRASGTPGEKVDVELRGHSDVEVTGFGLAIGHDPSRLEFLAARPGSFLEEEGGSVFFGAEAENGEGYATVYAGLGPSSPPVVVPPDSLLAILTYRILPGGRGRATLLSESLRFGDPPVASVYTTRGRSLSPALRHGSVAITSSVPDCHRAASLTVGSAKGSPGDLVGVELRGGSVCAVNGFGLAIGHDPRRVRFREVTPGRFLVDHSGSELFLFFDHTNVDGFMTLFVAFDLTDPLTVPAAPIPDDTVLAHLFYAISPDAEPGVVPLVNETLTVGDPRVANIYTTEKLEIRPRLESGSIVVGGVEKPPKRADDPTERLIAEVRTEPDAPVGREPEPGQFILVPIGGGQPETDIVESRWLVAGHDAEIAVFKAAVEWQLGAVEEAEDEDSEDEDEVEASTRVRYDLTAVFAACLSPEVAASDATMIGSLRRTVSAPGEEPTAIQGRVLLLELPPVR